MTGVEGGKLGMCICFLTNALIFYLLSYGQIEDGIWKPSCEVIEHKTFALFINEGNL